MNHKCNTPAGIISDISAAHIVALIAVLIQDLL